MKSRNRQLKQVKRDALFFRRARQRVAARDKAGVVLTHGVNYEK